MAAAKKPAPLDGLAPDGGADLAPAAEAAAPAAPITKLERKHRYRVWAHGALSISGRLVEAGGEIDLSDDEAASAAPAVERV